MRMWEIREGYDPREISYRHGKEMGGEYEEAFEEGYECGFGDAMRKVEEEKHFGFRGESRRTSGGWSYGRGGSYGSRMGYREDDEDDEDKYGERRRRRANGRYY